MDALKPAFSPCPARVCPVAPGNGESAASAVDAASLGVPGDGVTLQQAGAPSQAPTGAASEETRLRDILQGAVKAHLVGIPGLVAAALEACSRASDALAARDLAHPSVQAAASAMRALNAEAAASVLGEVGVAAEVEDSRRFARDFLLPSDNPPELASQAQGIVDRLESGSPSNLHTRALVLDDPGYMAFVKGGENVFVASGVLGLPEGERAGVIAHERAHLLARHMPEVSVYGYVAQELAARAVGNPPLAAAIRLVGNLDKAALQRNQEFVADAEGARMLAAAGYDPADMGRALTHVIANKSGAPDPMDDHPPLAARLDALAAQRERRESEA